MANYRRARSKPDTAPRRIGARPKTRLAHSGSDGHALTEDEKLLALAKERFEQSASADEKQRQREQDDLRFYADDQWPADLKLLRDGQAADANNGKPPVPARPCLVINKTLQPVAQLMNQERQMDLGAELIPADDFEGVTGTPIADTEIELREGLLRRIQRQPSTKDARSWAFERAAIAGRGYWQVMTRFCEGKTWDQEVYVSRFMNQACVSLDPFHELPDGSDAEWGFVGTDMPWEQYKAEFPTVAAGDDEDTPAPNTIATNYDDDEDFRALGETYKGWFTLTNKTRICRVVDYYYTVRESRTLCLLADGTSAWSDELPKKASVTDRREVIEKSVKWAKIDGHQVLDQGDWAGPDIPIIKVVGRELQPYDDDRHCVGLVRPMRDLNQALNYSVSKAMELTVGLLPMSQWVMPVGMDENVEQEWLLSATRVLGPLHYNDKDASGVPYGVVPQRIEAGPIGVEPMFNAIQVFDQFIQNVALTPQAATGDVDTSIKSPTVLDRVIQAGQRGTASFTDNQARSIGREATIINNLLYPIYGIRPGRLAKIVTGEGETQTIIVGQPFYHTTDPQGQSQPVPIPDNQWMPPEQVKSYALTPDAKFNVAVKVSKNYDTRREEQQQILADMITAIPEQMQVIGDKFYRSLDAPDANEMAERQQLMLAPAIQQMIANKKAGKPQGDPKDAMIQQLQQQLQQLQASGPLAVAQLKSQTDLQLADKNNQAKFQVTALQEQTKVQTNASKNDVTLAVASEKAETEKISAVLHESGITAQTLAGNQHEMAIGAADAHHAVTTQILDHAHEAAMGVQQAAQEQQAREHASQVAVTQAQQMPQEPQEPT